MWWYAIKNYYDSASEMQLRPYKCFGLLSEKIWSIVTIHVKKYVQSAVPAALDMQEPAEAWVKEAWGVWSAITSTVY